MPLISLWWDAHARRTGYTRHTYHTRHTRHTRHPRHARHTRHTRHTRYPSSCRISMLQVFHCVPLRGTWYLSVDPSVECYQREWNAWAAVSWIAITFYCVGQPVALWWVARRYHLCADSRAQRVGLLVNSCECSRSNQPL